MNLVGDFAKPMEFSGSELLLSFSSELLKDKWWCTGLQIDWLVAVVCGVEGPKDMFYHWKHGEF